MAFSVDQLEGGLAVVRIDPVEAALPGTLAVFTTRRGGVSGPPWDGLNLGLHVGDDPAAVAENRRRLFAALGVDPTSLVSGEQVHGDRVAVATVPGRHERTDGLVTAVPGLTLAIFCADCVPVFIIDPLTPAVAAVHAGWRGTVAGIAGVAVKVMGEAFGSRPRDLVAAIGPSIGPCCYEVGAEVAERAAGRFGSTVLLGDPPGGARGDSRARTRLDLWEANRLALLEAGLNPLSVHSSSHCTHCRPALFHSHRRATRRTAVEPGRPGGGFNTRSGRMAALVRLPHPALPGQGNSGGHKK